MGIARRGTIEKIADGDPRTMPATIDDPAILGEIEGALKGHREIARDSKAVKGDICGNSIRPSGNLREDIPIFRRSAPLA
jgi:hypothetical protein